MQKFLSKGLTKKILLVLVVMLLCNCIVPNYSLAIDVGVLVDPIKNLIALVGDGVMSIVNMCFTGVWIPAADAMAEGTKDKWEDHWAEWFGVIDWPTIFITPEEIFAGKIQALNANFFDMKNTDVVDLKENTGWGAEITNEMRQSIIGADKNIGTKEYQGDLEKLRGTIAKWYIFIRNISAAALFCVLIYIGIRVLISSVSEERAKYKSMIMNWLVAICLVFVLHYIMAGIMYVTEKAVTILREGGLGTQQYVVHRPESDSEEVFQLKHYAKRGGGHGDELNPRQPATVNNLVELVRVYVSLENRVMAFGYLIVYWVLIIYTVIFAVKYLKRFMYMAFLTMIAPLIAFTYPIDKVKDGTAQAFNKWFIEYLFNALLQPIHLLIYVVLVGSAASLIKVNFVYAIVALAFINRAEKLMKEIFGLNKASTPPSLGGTMLATNIMQRGYEKLRGGGSSSASAKASLNSGSSGGSSGSSSSKVRQSKGFEVYGNNNSNKTNESKSPEKPDSKLESKNNPLESGNNADTYMDQGTTPQANSIDSTQVSTPKTVSGEYGHNSHSSDNEKTKLRIKNPVVRTAKRGVKNALRFTGKKLGRGAIRTAAFAATAIPTLAAGAVAYAATGDAKYLGMGVGAAHAMSGRATDAILPKNGRFSDSKLAGAGRKIRTAYRQERDSVKEAAKQDKIDAFKRDKNNLDYIKQKNPELSNKEAKQKLNDMAEKGKDFIGAGYDNIEDIQRLNKMKDGTKSSDGTTLSSNQIMLADQMAGSSEVKNEMLMDEKASAKFQNKITKQIEAQGVNSNEANKQAQMHMDAMRISRGLAPASKTAQQPVKKPKTKTKGKNKGKRK